MKRILLVFCLLSMLPAMQSWGQQYISVPSKSGPMASDIDPDANLLVVANRDGNTISIVDLATRKILKTLAVGTTPTSVAINPRTHQAVVTNFGSDDISVVDLETQEVVDTISVGNSPRSVAIDVENNWAIVANLNDNSISLIDLNTGGDLLTTPITVGNFPISVAYNAVNHTAMVANYEDATIDVIDIKGKKKIGEFLVGLNPVDIAVCPEINRAVVANQGSGTVSIIQLSDFTVAATVTVGGRPFGVAINPVTKLAAAVANADQTISLIYLGDGFASDVTHDVDWVDNRNKKLAALITHVGDNPVHLSINPNDNTVLACNISSDRITIIPLDFQASLPFAIDTTDYRTNLILNNVGLDDATLNLTLFDKEGRLLASGAVKLPANGFKQINHINRVLLGNSTVSNTTGIIRITCDQPFSSLLTLIDNHTNDPSLLVGRTTGATRWLFNSLPNTATFQAQIAVWNPTTDGGNINLTLRNSLGATMASLENVFVPANGFYYSENVFSDLGSISQIGSLEVTSAYYSMIPIVLIKSSQLTGGFFEPQQLP